MNKTLYFSQAGSPSTLASTGPSGEDGIEIRSWKLYFVRLAMRASRARWFNLIRRVFHYQNGSSSSTLGSNPFNSGTWMMMEFVALGVQIGVISVTLGISRTEKPVWPMRIWVIGYDFGCILNLLLVYGRYWRLYVSRIDDSSDLEQQLQTSDEYRFLNLLNKCRSSLELFFAIWFVMGNVWIFESRLRSFYGAPKLHVLCISLLAWNAACYSFPFILFLLLCCCVPIISNFLGYNLNTGSSNRGARDDQISKIPTWIFNASDALKTYTISANESSECCICLTKYKEKEEIRRLPCSHVFHLKCVDQWLKIISRCPLCKRDIDSYVP